MTKKASRATGARILWVEGRWNSNPTFVPALLQKGFKVERVSSGKEAVGVVKPSKHALVVVDAASMRTSGTRICQSLRDRVNGMPILLISAPNHSVAKDFDCANVVLELPFTQRKLINRLGPLLPEDEDSLLKAGPIHLDLEARFVRVRGKKTSLTPRLVRLLKELIDHSGEVVKRNDLFKKVWRTDYTGDTRTLDVHISWLRQAIEKDPQNPELLKTHRGVGYCLEVNFPKN